MNVQYVAAADFETSRFFQQKDHFDSDNGRIRYFGDNRVPGQDPTTTPGNKALLAAFRVHTDPDVRVLLAEERQQGREQVLAGDRTGGKQEFARSNRASQRRVLTTSEVHCGRCSENDL